MENEVINSLWNVEKNNSIKRVVKCLAQLFEAQCVPGLEMNELVIVQTENSQYITTFGNQNNAIIFS